VAPESKSELGSSLFFSILQHFVALPTAIKAFGFLILVQLVIFLFLALQAYSRREQTQVDPGRPNQEGRALESPPKGEIWKDEKSSIPEMSRLDKMKLEVISVSRLTAGVDVTPMSTYPDRSAYFQNTTTAEMLELKFNGQSISSQNGQVRLVNQYSYNPVAAGDSKTSLNMQRFDLLLVPLGREVNGEAFERLLEIETRISVDGKMIWSKRGRVNQAFPPGDSYPIPLDNLPSEPKN
jgi:hypothetical protein